MYNPKNVVRIGTFREKLITMFINVMLIFQCSEKFRSNLNETYLNSISFSLYILHFVNKCNANELIKNILFHTST